MRKSAFLALLLATACAGPQDTIKGPLVPFAPEGLTSSVRPRRLALLIGIDEFEDPRFAALSYASNDALKFAEALSGFDDVRVLVTSKETSRAAVLQAIESLSRQVRSRDDTVVLYVSSHGSLGRKPGRSLQRYLVAHDTRLDVLAETGISVDHLVDRLARIPARGKVLFLATCHSGRGKSRVPDAVATTLAENKAPLAQLAKVSEAMLVFTAAAFGEVAKESSELEHDVYTNFLLEALDKGDRDGDGAVTATEAHDYARHRTYGFTGGLQRPTSEMTVIGDDPIVLSGRRERSPLPVIYSYARSAEGLVVRIDGRDKGVLPGGVAVDAGGHALALVDVNTDEVLYEGRIELEHGERVELTSLMPPPARLRMTVAAVSSVVLDARLRREFVPPTFGAEVRAALDHVLLRGTIVGAWLRIAGGLGRTEGFQERVPFSLLEATGGVTLGYGEKLGAVDIRATVDAGAGLLRRTFDTSTFEGAQSTSAFVLGPSLEASTSVLSWLAVGVEVGGGAVFVNLSEGMEVAPYVAFGVTATFLPD